ncbi:sulfatase family protein [Kineosporia babensis]|uniref:Sulfatase n=1 Tax=Kineosporia babensis TaxID=499548 RepID=A0A9X1NE28_9ACTN|nr:sulfatase [Kineosporia babensis]MCD5313282.1 sulfatase [Kineosporia babensis]
MRSSWRATVAAGFLITALVGCGTAPATPSISTPQDSATAAAPGNDRPADPANQPNIVFVLTDDLSMNLLKHLPAVDTLREDGTTFTNYFVTNSLCCPSRTTIMTGKYSHNTGIFRNHGATGGYRAFRSKHLDQDTFATDLQQAGYRTAMMGKFLNEYETGTTDTPSLNQPAGWDEWALGADAYKNYDYNLNQTGEVVHYGNQPEDYLTDVISERGRDFIERTAAAKQPFLLEISTYTPHKPYTPAERHKHLFKDAKVPRVKSYDEQNTNAPKWLAGQELTAAQKKKMDRQYRKRLQSVQSVSDLIENLRGQLRKSGVEDNTYFVFASDNGYHMGEHAMVSGKMTAFSTDINVPLVVVGPDVPAGAKVDEMAQSIDLRPTFTDVAGTRSPDAVDGTSLVPLWQGGSNDRNFVLVEHRGPNNDPNDPDVDTFRSPNPPNYGALRGDDWLYVEYVTGEKEYYDRAKDPSERHNIAGELSKAELNDLHTKLKTAEACSGFVACRLAQAAS